MQEHQGERLFSIVFSIVSFYMLNQSLLEYHIIFLKRFSIINVVTLLLFFILLVSLSRNLDVRVDRKKMIVFIFFLLVVTMGLISSIGSSYSSIKTTGLDLFLFSRFMIVYMFIIIFFSHDMKKKATDILIVELKCLTIFNFTLLFFNLLFHFLPYFDIRYGFEAQQLLYSHPTYLGSLSFFCWYFLKNDRKDIVFNFMNICLIISTLRSKLIILMIVYYLFYLFEKGNKIDFKKIILPIFGNGLLLLLFKGQIEGKLINNEAAIRYILMSNAKKIAIDCFPLGSGFGTYGSFTSFKYYSILYQKLGMNTVYGLLPNFYAFGMDSYYSMVLGQFGFLGLIFYILMLWFLCSSFLNLKHFELKKYAFILFLLLSFFTESTLNSSIGLVLFGILALDEKGC